MRVCARRALMVWRTNFEVFCYLRWSRELASGLSILANRITVGLWHDVLISCLQCSAFFFWINLLNFCRLRYTTNVSSGRALSNNILIFFFCHWNLESIQPRIPSHSAVMEQCVLTGCSAQFPSPMHRCQPQWNRSCGQALLLVCSFLKSTVCAVPPAGSWYNNLKESWCFFRVWIHHFGLCFKCQIYSHNDKRFESFITASGFHCVC